MPELEIDAVSKSYRDQTALHPVSLDVEAREFVVLLGPSGCGKSTLLRILMGILPQSGGQITLGGRRIEAEPPERRDVAMVFQTYALFPHMSVRDNLAFGMRMRGVPRKEQARRLAEIVEMCDLGAVLDRLPRNLSGGQQQRVALGRALAMAPRLMLYDEPLSNLDAKLRETLRADLVALHRRSGATSLYVTHDQTEAMAMADRVVVMNKGRIVETGAPRDLYHRPAHAFTARFLGQTNLLNVEARGSEALLPWGATARLDKPASGAATVSLRPENIILTPHSDGPGRVTHVTFAGAHSLYHLRFGDLELTASLSREDPALVVGARVAAAVLGELGVLTEETTS